MKPHGTPMKYPGNHPGILVILSRAITGEIPVESALDIPARIIEEIIAGKKILPELHKNNP